MAVGQRYHGYTNLSAAVSATLPVFTVVAPLTRRVHVYEFNVSSDATPADVAVKYIWQRGTADFTTPVAVTPQAIDSADGASGTLFTTRGTGTTLTANGILFQWSQNARANFRWIAAPDGELVIPQSVTNQTTTCNLLGLLNTVQTAQQNFVYSVHWAE